MDSSSAASSSSFPGGDSGILEWELDLPSAEDLTPLSQSLITPSLASAFSISPITSLHLDDLRTTDLDDIRTSDLIDLTAGDADADGDALPSKRRRLVWTPQLQRRFVEVVARLGVNNAVPKAIVQLMNVEGLTRENVASHLRKYRSYVKRVAANSDPSDPKPASPPVMMTPAFHSYGSYGAYHGN